MAFIDARTLPEGSEIEADLILIGGGLAGIALAKEWAGLNKSVAILESGGREFDGRGFDRENQDLYAGSAVLRAPGNPDQEINSYPFESRYRGLGGSGNIWGGKCVPLDVSDFAERDWLPLTGWPMSRQELQPYYDRSCRMLEIPLFGPEGEKPAIAGRPYFEIGDESAFFSAPRVFTRFSGGADREGWERFKTDYAEAANINVYLHANVTELKLHRNGRRLERLDVACLNGRRHTARARTYVLATGGIENARLMLASNSVREAGLGNENDLVGRHFMGHMNFSWEKEDVQDFSCISISDPNQNMTLYSQSPRDGVQCVIASTLEGQRRYRIGNFTVTFGSPGQAERHSSAIVALSGPLDRGGAAAAQLLPCYYKIEQLPNPESRITLDAASTDALGMPRVRLEWNFSAADLDMLEASVVALASAMGADGKGRVSWPAPREAIVSTMTPARHHMGTTKMHADPEHGVVDEDGRVHGVSNLYVAGSSVFPTSGNANPTLTIFALTMRLSDHLKQRMGARA